MKERDINIKEEITHDELSYITSWNSKQIQRETLS